MSEAYNVEIKARCPDLNAARAALLKLEPEVVGTDRQVDTYFHAPEGRLKLREGTIEHHLISYRRPDQAGPKSSAVRLYKPDDGEALKETLAHALEIEIVVKKTREIYFVNHVKIHLDAVDSLGTFVEVEAIGTEEEHEQLLHDCRRLMSVLGVEEGHLIENSYSDLLLEQKK